MLLAIVVALSVPIEAMAFTRRAFIIPAATAAALTARPAAFAATTPGGTLGYTDDAGMKSYSQVQRAWEKSATMSDSEKLLAARGVSMPRDGETESPKAAKRRAMAGCSMEEFRSKAGFASAADCNSKVLGGDLDQILSAMDGS